MDLLKEILITFSSKKKKEFEKFLVRKMLLRDLLVTKKQKKPVLLVKTLKKDLEDKVQIQLGII